MSWEGTMANNYYNNYTICQLEFPDINSGDFMDHSKVILGFGLFVSVSQLLQIIDIKKYCRNYLKHIFCSRVLLHQTS